MSNSNEQKYVKNTRLYTYMLEAHQSGKVVYFVLRPKVVNQDHGVICMGCWYGCIVVASNSQWQRAGGFSGVTAGAHNPRMDLHFFMRPSSS
jgi:hypothetical protein